jgi:serine/threonine protein kinase/WD40 repeat protein
LQQSIPAGTILGEYVISAPLGAGGMGEVYRARDPRLDRDVAVKVLPKSLSADPDRLRRFDQEARAAAALNHPNILAVYQMGTYEGMPYLVSELLEGETVREHLKRARMPLHKAIAFGIQIAQGLAAAHDKGIVHRDIKPENLFITKDGRAKILDFGLARLSQPRAAAAQSDQTLTLKTDPGILLGTVGYMSPEQVRGEPADNRSDIFAFGVVLYEMVTGKQTFHKGSSVETMSAILNEEPSSISQLAADTPFALQKVVHRCLEKAPQQRFQSASDLAFALESIENNAAVIAASASKRLRVAITAAALVIALGVALLAFLGTRTAPVPLVSSYLQLTHDGAQKNLLGTDGSRLYLGSASSAVQGVAVIPVSGGEPRTLSLTDSPNMFPLSLSPDGSEILLVNAVGVPPRGPLWSVPVLGGSPRRLGDAIGIDGSWSRDGSKLAYCDGNDLYAAEGDGSHSRKLVSMKSIIARPAWSPDGARIRFDTLSDPGSIVGERASWEISANGTDLHRLFAGQQNSSDECCGQWTADGKYFVFQSLGQIWALPEKERFSFSTPTPIQLTSSPMSLYGPLPSKDGKKLFVVGRTYRGELMRLDLKSSNFSPFLAGISAEYPAFSKDGQWVAYTTYPEGNIWRSRVDGTARVQLTFSPLYGVMPRWSPDGKRIIFFKFADGNKPARMYEIPAEGGSPRELLPDDPHNHLDPNFSPDGSKIVFGGDLNDVTAADNAAGIRVLDLATNQISTLPDSQRLFSPRWSPDGNSIAALTSDSSAIVVFDLNSKKWRELTRGSLGWLSWSKDGQYIFSLDFEGKGGVLRIRLNDGKKEKVVALDKFVTTGRYGGSLALAPDDSPLLLRDEGTQDVYALDWKTP